MTNHVLLIIASLLVSGELSYGADPDYIRLDLSPLRGRDVPSNTKAYPQRIPVEPSVERVAIFCTDSTYPNDIFCDVRTFYDTMWDNSSSYITKVVIEYPHPKRSDVACNVIFKKEQAENYPLPRLPYSRFSCSPSFNDTEVPVFQLTEANRLSISLTGDIYFCLIHFKNSGRVNKSVLESRRITVIKFEVEEFHCEASVAIGRPPPEKECENDGRRCRPVNQ